MEKIFILVALNNEHMAVEVFKTKQDAIQHVVNIMLGDANARSSSLNGCDLTDEDQRILAHAIRVQLSNPEGAWWHGEAPNRTKYQVLEKKLPWLGGNMPAMPTKRYVVKGMLSGVLGKKIFDTEKKAVEYAVRAVENEYKRRNTPIDVDALRLHLTTAKWIGKEDLYYGVYEYKPETDDALPELPDLETLKRMPEYN